ncbi:DUF2461 domain-containing protein [Pelagibacterium halotolerans]|uniref:DUF2461 domain-containing protein n=1 Tax=Pelagibacterium halotolerans TaxID=531813 RepID=UPI003850093A
MLSEQTRAFLADLKANNNREWFEANKERYRTALKEPAEHFAQAMALALEAATGMPQTPRIFRIYRDVRFSKDKTPYNAHLHIGFRPSPSSPDMPAWMLGLEPDRLVVGTGLFAFSPDGLTRWREAVSGPEGNDLASVLSALIKDGIRINDPELKRVPAPYPADHPNADLLRRKSLAVWIDCRDPALAYGETGPDACTRELLRLKPVFDWLADFADADD